MTLNSQSLLKEQVLIVGCGDIGERFAKILPQTSYAVTGLRRNPPANLPHLRYQTCDATDATQLDQVIQRDIFAVILISMTPGERSDAGYQLAYVQTCKNLVTSLRKHQRKPRLLVFVSSTGVYGQNDGSWVDENSPTQPESFSGKRLLEAEQVIQASGFSSVILRCSGIYGPGRNRLIDLVQQGRANLSPQITNRIHADDCAAAVAHLLELQALGVVLDAIYLVTDNMPVAMVEVLGWLALQLKVAVPVGKSETDEGIHKRCSNKRLLATGFTLTYPDYRVGYSTVLAASQ